MKRKCPNCNSCCDIVWILPRRFFHCWLCDIYYDFLEGKMITIDIEAATGISNTVLREQFYGKAVEK